MSDGVQVQGNNMVEVQRPEHQRGKLYRQTALKICRGSPSSTEQIIDISAYVLRKLKETGKRTIQGFRQEEYC